MAVPAGAGASDGVVAGLPYFRFGQGPPVVVFPGLGPYNTPTKGFARRLELRYLRRLANQFTVYSVNRRVGLPDNVTMKEIAADCAAAVAALALGPVPIIGVSTGGAVALQLAIDRPGLLSHLVLVSSGARLSETTRAACEAACREAEAGKVRACNRALTSAAFGPGLTRTVVGWLAWLTAPLALPRSWDPRDMVRTMRADNAFDVTSTLASVTVPTLIINGTLDPSYPADHSRDLARRIPGAELLLYQAGHGGVLMKSNLWPDVGDFLRRHR